MSKNVEERPLNYKSEEHKNTKRYSPRTTIHVGSDSSGANDLGLNINTNLTVSTPKLYKIFLAITLFTSTFIIVVGSLILIHLYNELKSLKNDIILVEQKFDHRLAYAIKQPQIIQREYSYHNTNHETNDLYSSQKAQMDLKQDQSFPVVNKKSVPAEVHFQNSTSIENNVLQRNNGIAHFIGALPDITLHESGPIGPWFMDDTISSPSETNPFDLTVDAESVIINKKGIYFIYAQMIYLTRQPSCYCIVARNTDQKQRILAECCTGNDSTPPNGAPGEMSCAVNTVVYLNKREIVYLRQREAHRTFSMNDGQSHFGLISLS